MTTNENNSHNYCGFWRRVAAYSIDIFPIVLVVFLFSYYFLGFDQIFNQYLSDRNNLAVRADFLKSRNHIRDISFLFWIVYCTLMEASTWQGTFGKVLAGGKVVDENGARISLKKSFVRNILKVISALPFFIGFLWVLFSKKKQTWHDKIAQTYVVSR